MNKCEWAVESDPDYEFWNTECENAFQFTDGGPKENDFKFCPYCGGELVVVESLPI